MAPHCQWSEQERGVCKQRLRRDLLGILGAGAERIAGYVFFCEAQGSSIRVFPGTSRPCERGRRGASELTCTGLPHMFIPAASRDEPRPFIFTYRENSAPDSSFM